MRQEKQLLLDEIKEKIDHAKAMVLTRYQKLDPNLASEFRVAISNTGGTFEVVRKRILIKAAQVAGISFDLEALQGHIGVVFAEKDPLQTTKELYRFREAHEEVLEVLGGRFEGALYSAKDVENLSKLPSKEEMRSQLLATFEAPMSQTLAVMEAILTTVIYCLENKSSSEQKV